MKKPLFFLILLLPLTSWAQQTRLCELKGIVIDTLSAPVPAAVVLLSNDDGVATGSAITDKDGRFSFGGLSPDSYVLMISHLSYSDERLTVEFSKDTMLVEIVLRDNIQNLDAIQVLATNINYSADRYRTSLAGNPYAKGKTAAEMLDLLPAVSNNEGKLTIFGRPVLRVRINGRLASASELEALQAEYIKNVEIVYNVGVSDRSPQRGGEINIQIEKPQNGGYYGTVTGLGTANFEYGITDGGANSIFNYGNKKWSVHNHINYYYNDINYYDHFSTRYNNQNSINSQDEKRRGWGNTFSNRLSVTYDISKRHIIGTNLLYNYNKTAPENVTMSLFTDFAGNETGRSLSESNGSNATNRYQVTLDYQWKLDDKGSGFRLSTEYMRNQADNERQYRNIFNLGTRNESGEYMDNLVDNHVDIYLVDAKLTLKTGKKGTLEVGGIYDANRTRQVLNYSDMVNGSWVENQTLSDNYRLRGDNYVGFASFTSSLGKRLTYKAGLRYEHREMSYDSRKVGLNNHKNIDHLMVTADLMYTINRAKGSMMTLNYIRFMNDFPYSSITPVITYYDEYSYSKGNLALKPATGNLITFNLMLNQKWGISLMYGQVRDLINQRTFIDEDNPLVTYTMPVNEGRIDAGMLSVERTLKMMSWWTMKLQGQWSIFKERGEEAYNSGNFRWTNNFVWKKGWGGSTSFYIEPYRKIMSGLTASTNYSGSASIYKRLLKDALRINLSCTMFGKRSDQTTLTEELWRKQYRRTELRRIDLRVVYNFKSGKKVNVKFTDSQKDYQEMKDASRE